MLSSPSQLQPFLWGTRRLCRVLPREGPRPRCVCYQTPLLFHRPEMPWKSMHQGCLVALHMGLLLPRWFRTAWHLSVILASQHGPFPGHNILSSWEPFLCPLRPPSLSCVVHRSLVCMKQGKSPKAFIPWGLGPSHTAGLWLARRKHLW